MGCPEKSKINYMLQVRYTYLGYNIGYRLPVNVEQCVQSHMRGAGGWSTGNDTYMYRIDERTHV